MRFRTLSGVCVAALMIAASVQMAAADTIKIGVFGPMSGDAAAMGSAEKDSVNLAVAEKNELLTPL